MTIQRPIHRDEPLLPAEAMKTYQVARPLATHWRDASCDEVGCEAHQNGWRTVVDESGTLGQRQAAYIRTQSGRRFSEAREDGLTVFTFGPGQRCFATHRVPLDREPLFVVRDGDWRGNPRRTQPRVLRARDWIDDFQSHQDRLATRLGRS